MCRIVVYAKRAPINPRPEEKAAYQRGDVVRIASDGEFLGKDIERGFPAEHPGEVWWNIIELPGVSADDFLHLLVRDMGNTGTPFTTDLGYRTHKRAKHLDLDALRGNVTKQAVLNSVRIKTPAPRSTVIG